MDALGADELSPLVLRSGPVRRRCASCAYETVAIDAHSIGKRMTEHLRLNPTHREARA